MTYRQAFTSLGPLYNIAVSKCTLPPNLKGEG